MMEIEITEENNQQLLSKTQKQKIRRLVKEVWDDEMGFYDHIEDVLGQIYYDPLHEDMKYNHIEHNLVDKNHLRLVFKRVHIETPEERRKNLQKKLKNAIHNKKHGVVYTDPHEKMYQQLCQQLPEQQRKIIPKPSHVKANLDMYRQMLTMIPNQNPLHQYISGFMVEFLFL